MAIGSKVPGGVGKQIEDPDLGPSLTLEHLLDDPTLGNFRMSRLQRSFVRACDGSRLDAPWPKGVAAPPAGAPPWRPLTVEERLTHFGQAIVPLLKPTTIIPMTGVRAGKTLIAAFGLVQSLLTCSLRHVPTAEELADGVLPDADGMTGVRPGELVRAPIVTPRMAAGKQAFSYVLGIVNNSPRLKKYVVEATKERLIIRRPSDGHHVVVELLAAAAGGTNLRSTWLAGIIFDEAAFFDDGEGDDQALVNLADNYGAAAARMLPGAIVWLPSSPWADSGTFHTMWARARGTFGSLDDDGDPSLVMSFHSTSRAMNPALSRKLENARRREAPLEATREYDAVPLSTLSNLLLPPAVMAKLIDATRPLHLPYEAGVIYTAGTDLGLRRNSSAIALARNEHRLVDGVSKPVTSLVYHEELVPAQGTPLRPQTVIHHFGSVCQGYGCEAMEGDLAYVESAHEHLASLKGAPVAYIEYVPTQESNATLCGRFRDLAAEGLLNLPNDPRLLSQLKRILIKPAPGGKTQIIMPTQGRAHGDLAIAVILAVVRAADANRYIGDPDDRWDRYNPVLQSAGL